MKNGKLWSLAGVLVVAAGAYGLSESEFSVVSADAAHNAYVGCLSDTYDRLGSRHETLAVRAYQKCAGLERKFVAHLLDQGISDDRIHHVVVRVNEAAFARYLGVGIEQTRGCLRSQENALIAS